MCQHLVSPAVSKEWVISSTPVAAFFWHSRTVGDSKKSSCDVQNNWVPKEDFFSNCAYPGLRVSNYTAVLVAFSSKSYQYLAFH